MFIVKNRKFFFTLSALLIAGSIAVMVMLGFNFGIDFKGGSILEVSYSEARPEAQVIKTKLDTLGLGTYIMSPVGTNKFVLKMRDITPAEKTAVLQSFVDTDPAVASTYGEVKEERFNSIGPVVGAELKNKALLAIAIVILCMLRLHSARYQNLLHHGNMVWRPLLHLHMTSLFLQEYLFSGLISMEEK
jgi:preprotein translocase subunit SecF